MKVLCEIVLRDKADEKKIKSDNREIRTHACEHNALAGRRLNHSARLSYDFLVYFCRLLYSVMLVNPFLHRRIPYSDRTIVVTDSRRCLRLTNDPQWLGKF